MKKTPFEPDGVRHATINGQRFHLRLTETGAGSLLWINGNQPPLILDQTGASFIAHLIDAMWLYQQGEGDESQAVIEYVTENSHRWQFILEAHRGASAHAVIREVALRKLRAM